MNGTIQDKAEGSLSDNDLLNQFRKVEKLPDDKKRLVKEFLDAFCSSIIFNNKSLLNEKAPANRGFFFMDR